MDDVAFEAAPLRGAPLADPGSAGDPVFVLCMGRSGSTLLRFVLDAHPMLACPPETCLPKLFEQLAVVWSLIEGAPLSPNRGDAPPMVPDAAVAGIRRTADMIIDSYLARRGRPRFCDKSLGTARYTELVLRVYPGTRFLCLYRHPMDVIRSALDACPWGLTGYGFDAYAGSSPGNSVAALASYWLDNASMIAAVEDRHPDLCHRVRYEDLVAAPEEVAGDIFSFLRLPPTAGVARRCLADRTEPFGPGDHKIWTTSAITADSVGSGQSIPSGLIPPPVAEGINGLLGRLGYVAIDHDWGTPGRPSDPRLPGSARRTPAAAAAAVNGVTRGDPAGADRPAITPLEIQQIGQCLRAALARADSTFLRRWSTCAEETFLIVARPRWLADLGTRTVRRANAEDEAEWSIVGPVDTWLAVTTGQANLSGAVRNWLLRYCDASDSGQFTAQVRISMLAELLGPAPVPGPRPAPGGQAAPEPIAAVAAP
jgi:hypothetical protein